MPERPVGLQNTPLMTLYRLEEGIIPSPPWAIDDEWPQTLCCPKCVKANGPGWRDGQMSWGGENGNLHMTDVTVRGADTTVINHMGIATFPEGITQAAGLVGSRGVQVEIAFVSEQCGHDISLILQFHKGDVYATWGVHEDARPVQLSRPDIWRD